MKVSDLVLFTLKKDRSKLPERLQAFYTQADGKQGYIDHIMRPDGQDEIYHVVMGAGVMIWAHDYELTEVRNEQPIDDSQLSLF